MSDTEQPNVLGFTDLDAMQEIVAQMQRMMEELQKESDKEAVLVEKMRQHRLRWTAQHSSSEQQKPRQELGEETATTIASYMSQVPYVQAVMDFDPRMGRILRAQHDLEPGDIFLVEDVLVESPDDGVEPYRSVLGFFTGTWGVIRAMSACNASQEALIADMANAHQDKQEAWASLVHGFRQKGLDALPQKTDLQIALLIGIIHSNAFQYKDEQARTWRGLFPLAAIMSHSCRPNVAYVVENHRIFFHAIRPVARGQELVQSYVQGFTPAHRRQRILWETFGFVCQCEVCAASGENGAS